MYPLFAKSDFSLKHPLRNIRVFFRKVKWAFQRTQRRYSDYDVGEIQTWFICVVPDMLRAFRRRLDEQLGYPIDFHWDFYDEHKEEIGCSYLEFCSANAPPAVKAWQDRVDTEGRERWKSTIDRMIFLFSESDEDTCQTKNPLPQIKYGTHEYSEEERKIEAYRLDCRKEALAMFEKWYDKLWI